MKWNVGFILVLGGAIIAYAWVLNYQSRHLGLPEKPTGRPLYVPGPRSGPKNKLTAGLYERARVGV